MPKVEVKKKFIWVGKKKIPLIAGEVHYWRLNPGAWPEILDRVKEMGLDIISTYVPWHYHEYKRGSFDFTGKTEPTRDLKAFLELTRKKKMWVIIRPGPYIYSEWPNDGVPEYAYKYHRLHPTFLAYAEAYLKEVSKVIKPYQASNAGGHIILLQADNEIDAWPDLFGDQYGLGRKPGMFQDFVRDLYAGDLPAFNKAWATDYRSFNEAGAFIATMLQGESGLALKGDHELRRNLDYFKFKYFYAKKCADWNVKAYRKLGFDIPIYLNLYPFFYAHDWADFQEVSDLVGLDIYPTAELAEDKFEARKYLDKMRYLSQVSKLPFIAEFESGVWHNRHYETGVLTPNHYRLLAIGAMMGGVAGWSWYMLVNRDNWYMSPINEWGRVRHELYNVFKQVVSIYRQIEPPSLKKISDVAVTFMPLQYAARTMPHNSPILVALHDADIDYEIHNPELGMCRQKYLFYSGNQWLEEKGQENLRNYVENGGTLIAFRNFPRKNQDFEIHNQVGFEEPVSTLFEFKKAFEIQFAPGRPKIQMVSSVFAFKNPEGTPVKATFDRFGEITIGYVKKIGKGKILHLGVEPTQELINEILDYLEAPIASRSRTRDVKTALFQRGKSYYLIAVNNGTEDKSVSVDLPTLEKMRCEFKVLDLVDDTKETVSRERCHPFNFNIQRKDGKVFVFTPRA